MTVDHSGPDDRGGIPVAAQGLRVSAVTPFALRR